MREWRVGKRVIISLVWGRDLVGGYVVALHVSRQRREIIEWRIGKWVIVDLIWGRDSSGSYVVLLRVFRRLAEWHYQASRRIFGVKLECENIKGESYARLFDFDGAVHHF